ncbi:PP-loop family-domain-containing protein [Infundibulicybe gibba]|nr:PP-loop family-domain-containing protein [Infundibulicybe gibba]
MCPSNRLAKHNRRRIILGVANSGGPDSTCLLFLMNRCIGEDPSDPKKLPGRAISMGIDHALQPSSSSMAERCADTARSIGVEHITARVPWSQHPFPSTPAPGESFENVARLARYHLLFQTMKQYSADVLAFGHHADDQVETSLMRLGRGTTEFGAAGMRKCRRWGMGLSRDEGGLGWAGNEGMTRWIVRPLLDFNKDRILATCDEHKLEYVTDSTNFQPNLTLRNAVRYAIAHPSEDLQRESGTIFSGPHGQVKGHRRRWSSLSSVTVDITSGPEQLRGAVKELTSRVEDIDRQVTSSLHRCSLPSLPGTFLMSSRGLANIRDEMVRMGMILRIMRYVSFHPWGSVRADGNRRQASIQQIIEKLWTPNPFRSGIKCFIKTPERVNNAGVAEGETIGWLASRQPPLSRYKMEQQGIKNPLRLDITKFICDAITAWQSGTGEATATVLYDCRFLVEFDLSKIPGSIVADLLSSGSSSPRSWGGNEEQVEENHKVYWKRRDDEVVVDWITVRWIRSLESI